MLTPRKITFERLDLALSLCFCLLAFALAAGFGIITVKGVDASVELIKKIGSMIL
jgi:hypothetical protein